MTSRRAAAPLLPAVDVVIRDGQAGRTGVRPDGRDVPPAELGVIDAGCLSLTDAVREAEVAVFCTPVDQVAPQREGMSAFTLKEGAVHHTYSTYDRGVEQLIGTYRMLDLAPLGRNEEGPAAWWHRHDEYETAQEEAAG